MKKLFVSAVVLAALSLTACKGETGKEEAQETTTQTEVTDEMALTETTFGVRGNCGMCKSTIEKAANAVEGVELATWDVDKKQVKVAFDADKTNLETIHKAIAASGYDTDKVLGDVAAYDELPGCCQYDHEMAMNQSGEKKAEAHSGHNSH